MITPTSVEQILIAADSYNENHNYHDLCGIPEDVFNAIEKYVPARDHLKVAMNIADVLTEGGGWKSYCSDEEDDCE